MVVKLLAKTAWGVTKFTVKHVVVPIATTAVIAVAAQSLADAIRPREEAAHAAVAPDLQPSV